MGEPKAVSHSSEIESFLDTMFDGQEGYVYTPTKTPESAYWQPYFFSWPKHRTAIITHILDQTKSKECYVAPSLFKAPSAEKPAWKGTNHVWVEFDGNAPVNLPTGIPDPSYRVQSSEQGHEHWYWRLSEFETDFRVIEQLSKRLAYTLDADKSGWDANQVLRPPGTIHHDSGKRVATLSVRNSQASYGDFTGLVEVSAAAVLNTTFESLPDIQEVIAKYKWNEEALDLFRKDKQPTGSRSSAMTRLGFECVEMGMTNEECYVVLLNADDRWGKFKTRSPEDRAKRLIGIITHCRGEKSVQAELNLSDTLAPIYSWSEFNDSKVEPPEWLFDGLLAEQGLLVLSGDPSVGKSTVSMYLCMRAILNQPFLTWKFNTSSKQINAAFVSFEMQPSECKGFLDEMAPGYDSQGRSLLGNQFFLIPEGSSVDLSKKEFQQEVLDRLLSRQINLVVFDSLKAMTMNEDTKVRIFLDWVTKVLRKKHKMTVIIIAHNRKPPGTKSERGPLILGDVYGGMEITADATAVVALGKRSMKNVLTVAPLKIRSAEEPPPFLINREKYLQFSVADKTVTEKADKVEVEEEVAEVVSGEESTESNPNLFG